MQNSKKIGRKHRNLEMTILSFATFNMKMPQEDDDDTKFIITILLFTYLHYTYCHTSNYQWVREYRHTALANMLHTINDVIAR